MQESSLFEQLKPDRAIMTYGDGNGAAPPQSIDLIGCRNITADILFQIVDAAPSCRFLVIRYDNDLGSLLTEIFSGGLSKRGSVFLSVVIWLFDEDLEEAYWWRNQDFMPPCLSLILEGDADLRAQVEDFHQQYYDYYMELPDPPFDHQE